LEVNIDLKPYVFINCNDSKLAVTNTIGLDASWQTGGQAALGNVANATFSGGVNLDFDALLSTGVSDVMFTNIRGGGATYTVNGSTSGDTKVGFNTLNTTDVKTNINVTNAKLDVRDCILAQADVTHNDAAGNRSAYFSSVQVSGGFTILSQAGQMLFYTNGLSVGGNTTYDAVTPGIMTVNSSSTTYGGGLKIEDLTGGLLTVNLDNLTTTPIINGTPTINYISLASGMNADFPSPVNYTPTTPEVTGHLEGIDAALSASSQDLQTTYDNSVDGNINLSIDKHITYTATDAAFRLSSMTQAQFNAMPTPPNGLMAWANDADRVRVNKGTPGVPNYDELAYLTDITAILADAAYGEMSFQGNALATAIAIISTPVQVNATYVNGDLLNFTSSLGVLTYTDTEAREVLIEASLTAEMAVIATADVGFTIFKNGSAIAKSAMVIALDGVTPSPKSITVSCLTALVTSDTLDIRVQNNSGTEDILVTNLNIKATSLGGTSSPGGTLQDAYDNGDGTITQSSNSKPLELISTSDTITPFFNSRLDGAFSVGQTIFHAGQFGFNDALSSIQYASMTVQADGILAGLENATINYRGKSAGSTTIYLQYSGLLNSIVFPVETRFSDQIMRDIGEFTQAVGNSLFNEDQAAGTFTIRSAASATAFVLDYSAGTANFAIPLSVSSFGVNYTRGVCVVPTPSYTFGVQASVITAMNGTQTVAAGTLGIGHSVDMSFDFNLVPVNPGVIAVGGDLNFIFGGIVNSVFSGIQLTDTNSRVGSLSFKITRIDATTIQAAVRGSWVNTTVDLKPLFTLSGTFAYSDLVSNLMDVEWLPNVGNGTNFLNLVAYNLRIVQYS